ncbi:MAG TPA: thiamine phosphate synthase [Candidatus Nitrosotalea sp.]|nr:thiamine phosphate synthase [Candidatus Nitrosotalea sp.]
MRLPSPLYAILDRSVAGGRDLPDLLEAVLSGGCRLVQLREKTLPPTDLFPLAQRLVRRCREVGAWLIVNDRADLAVACEAHGLHVGQEDLPARQARAILKPGMILGVSTHDPEQARRAVADGADYVAVGSIFPTTTKAGFQLVGPELIRRVRPEVPVPLVGIGGITPENAAEVLGAGADAVAVISALCAAPDPEAATRLFLARIARPADGARAGQ